MKNISYNENYFVDKDGNVYSKTGRILKCSVNSIGYKQLFTYKEGKFDKAFCVHRLVYETFVGEIPRGFEIDHINRNRLDNRLENLRVVTHKENVNNRNPVDVLDKKIKNEKISLSMKKYWEEKRISTNL